MRHACPCGTIIKTEKQEIAHSEHSTTRTLPAKELEFVCRKCGHHLFVKEARGWVKKVTGHDCPACGEEAEGQWDGLWFILGYGRFADWKGRVL